MGRALQRQLGHQRTALLDDVHRQLLVPQRIHAAQAGAQHCDGFASNIQRALMGSAVDTQSQATGDDKTTGRQAAGKTVRSIQARP
ncbi:hypothetical protein FQZ97_835520 [compost metagenome]